MSFSFSRFNTQESLISENLDESTLSNSTLKVLFNSECFAYCVVNPQNEVLAICDFKIKPTATPSTFEFEDIANFFRSEELLKKTYSNTIIAYQNNYHCIVNDILNNENSATNNLKLCVPDLINNEPYTVKSVNFLKNHSLLYSQPLALEKVINKTFKNEVHLTNSFANFSKQILNEATIFSARKMFLNFYANKCEVLVLDGASLLHANTYMLHNEKDFLFNVFSIGKLTNFDFENEDLFFTGNFKNEEVNYFSALETYSNRRVKMSCPRKYILPQEIRGTYSPYYNLICL